ncbi:MAG: membrane dipeptidase [Myxococcales bacterium]|nr:MAG: membrane dipeptidase [Myxococcales bacterium]
MKSYPHHSDAVQTIHAECPAIDLHADPLLWTKFVGYDLNKKHKAPLPHAWFGGHVDVPRLIEGGLGAQFFGLVSLPVLDADLGAAIDQQIDFLRAACDRSDGRLKLVTSAEAFLKQSQHGVAALLGIEGAHCLEGSLSRLEHFAARGVRYLGLLHFSANACGFPAMGFGVNHEQGLTNFGCSVIESCEQQGVIVDLAHINKKGFMQACSIAQKPMYVSHTAVSGVHSMWRNIDDEQLRAVADNGGAVGVIFCPAYLGQDGIPAVVEHLKHIIKVGGESLPALGSDWDGFIRPTQGLEDASKLPHLTQALLDAGMTHALVQKILQRNALRVLQDVPEKQSAIL